MVKNDRRVPITIRLPEDVHDRFVKLIPDGARNEWLIEVVADNLRPSGADRYRRGFLDGVKTWMDEKSLPLRQRVATKKGLLMAGLDEDEALDRALGKAADDPKAVPLEDLDGLRHQAKALLEELEFVLERRLLGGSDAS